MALTAEASIHVVRTGKGDIATVAAERDLSAVNPVKDLAVLVAVVVIFSLA